VTVLGLAGSCRRGGNTETLLDWCLDAAREEGAEVVKFRLADLDLHVCRGCEACSKTGSCVLKDDMGLLYPYLQEADSIVLAAPVYAMGMPALPKMVIDRCQPYWALKYVLKEPLRPRGGPERLGAFLSCAGTTFDKVFDGSSRVVRYLWHVLDATSAGELLCPGVDARGTIEAEPGARTVSEDIGRRLGRPRDEGRTDT
jgi:hypothetical protein